MACTEFSKSCRLRTSVCMLLYFLISGFEVKTSACAHVSQLRFYYICFDGSKFHSLNFSSWEKKFGKQVH